jgi:CRP-like cAMP-binding protein
VVENVASDGSGDFLGEIALLCGSARTATATAATDLEVLVCPTGEFRTMPKIAPSVAHKVRRASLARSAVMDIAAGTARSGPRGTPGSVVGQDDRMTIRPSCLSRHVASPMPA